MDLQITVPFDMPLSLSVMSKAARLADGNGMALPVGGAQSAFRHTAGDPNPRSFIFTVTGVVP